MPRADCTRHRLGQGKTLCSETPRCGPPRGNNFEFCFKKLWARLIPPGAEAVLGGADGQKTTGQAKSVCKQLRFLSRRAPVKKGVCFGREAGGDQPAAGQLRTTRLVPCILRKTVFTRCPRAGSERRFLVRPSRRLRRLGWHARHGHS
jgi:hypothetical protein